MVDKKPPPKRQLEIQLAKLKILEKPKLRLEQYPVSPQVASELLYMAGFEHDDLHGSVVDLGTGTGRLAIGAALMNAKTTTGVDVDGEAIAIARQNTDLLGVKVNWIESSIDQVEGSYDTVVMNPPFGTRNLHADVDFLRRAFRLAPNVYSIHKSSTRYYLVKYVEKMGGKILESRTMDMAIPHLFGFHKRKWKSVEVDLHRIGC